MSSIRLRAHFDGDQIRLDEPFELDPDAELIVTVLPKNGDDVDREFWTQVSRHSLARAYGEDEPEYSFSLIREPNPDYDGR